MQQQRCGMSGTLSGSCHRRPVLLGTPSSQMRTPPPRKVQRAWTRTVGRYAGRSTTLRCRTRKKTSIVSTGNVAVLLRVSTVSAKSRTSGGASCFIPFEPDLCGGDGRAPSPICPSPFERAFPPGHGTVGPGRGVPLGRGICQERHVGRFNAGLKTGRAAPCHLAAGGVASRTGVRKRSKLLQRGERPDEPRQLCRPLGHHNLAWFQPTTDALTRARGARTRYRRPLVAKYRGARATRRRLPPD